MKQYYNETTKKWYFKNRAITKNFADGSLFSGIPTIEQLTEWGFVEYIPSTPPPLPEPSSEDELDDYEALQIITGGIEE